MKRQYNMKTLIGQQESNRKYQEKRRRAAGVPTKEELRIKNMHIFIQVAENVHKNKYDYSKVVYVNSITKVKIRCPKHGVFYQIPDAHKTGQNCPKCALRMKHDGFRKTLSEFIDISNNKHDNKYDYSLSRYINNKTKLTIICPIHGQFTQRAGVHMRGQGCPCCGAEARIMASISSGELKVIEFLKEQNINFIPQKTFDGCKYKRLLSFDFYLPNYNLLIEFDGEQHYKFFKKFHSTLHGFEVQQTRDKIKTQYAYDNGIKLLRIRWDEEKMISNILNNFLFN